MPKNPTIDATLESLTAEIHAPIRGHSSADSIASWKVIEPHMAETLEREATLTRRERESNGDSFDGRMAALASTLQLPGKDLVKLVQYWLARLPATDPNRIESRQDLEQEITLSLMAQIDRVKGNWDIGKMVVMDAYSTYYRAYRAQGAIGEPQALSLEGKMFRELLDALAVTGEIPTFEDKVPSVDNADRLEQVLPAPIRNAIRKRLMGQTLNAAERGRLKRFRDATTAKGVDGNTLQAQAILEGSTNEPKWIGTNKRGGSRAGSGRKPKNPGNGPIIIVHKAKKTA